MIKEEYVKAVLEHLMSINVISEGECLRMWGDYKVWRSKEE